MKLSAGTSHASCTPVACNRNRGAESIALSKDLKKQGWKFVGPTTVYAFMQAMGLISDHDEECVMRAAVERARRKFKRPGR